MDPTFFTPSRLPSSGVNGIPPRFKSKAFPAPLAADEIDLSKIPYRSSSAWDKRVKEGKTATFGYLSHQDGTALTSAQSSEISDFFQARFNFYQFEFLSIQALKHRPGRIEHIRELKAEAAEVFPLFSLAEDDWWAHQVLLSLLGTRASNKTKAVKNTKCALFSPSLQCRMS